MNTGQMVLTVGAMVLLGLTVMSVNGNTLQTSTILQQTEQGVYAISFATTIIEKASGMNFDEQTVLAPDTLLTQITLPANLGPDAGEPKNNPNKWDDFDDFNRMDTTITVPGIGYFRSLDTVYYVTDLKPDVGVPSGTNNGRSWHKRMDVRVFGTIGRGVFEQQGAQNYTKGIDTIKMSYVFSYFTLP